MLRYDMHLSDWDTLSRELKRAKLRTTCGAQTLRRFEDVHAQCIQAFRDWDAWLWESYDLIESEGENAPTRASARRLGGKITSGAEALGNRLLRLRGKLELISKDLFENWRAPEPSLSDARASSCFSKVTSDLGQADAPVMRPATIVQGVAPLKYLDWYLITCKSPSQQ